MRTACRISNAPANLSAFVTEITPQFEKQYGSAAAAFYSTTAVSGIAASIASPLVRAYGCMEQDRAAGMLLVRFEGDRKVINFLHVLLPYRGRGFEERLLESMLRDFGEGPGEVITEYVPYYPMALEDTFTRHGFAQVKRQIMRRATSKFQPQVPNEFVLGVADESTVSDLAEVLVDAYTRHSERFLFPEVQSQENARAYLRRVQSGAFGVYRPNYGIGAWTDGGCAGFVIGCQVLPGLGFTLHLAVRPDFRGRGLGRNLLAALASVFAEECLDYIALGVTCDNPAVFLYQRAGFNSVANVPVYYRLDRAFPPANNCAP